MTKALDEIRRLFTEGTLAGLSDGQLLERVAPRHGLRRVATADAGTGRGQPT